MFRNFLGFTALLAVVFATGSCKSASAAAINVNFDSEAGAVALATWNNISNASGSYQLSDSAGNPNVMQVNTPSTANVGASGVAVGAPYNGLMTGHIYNGGQVPVTLTFPTAVPYAVFDLYIYYNSSAVTNRQQFTLATSGASVIVQQFARELSNAARGTPETSFVLSTGSPTEDANYVRFAGISSAALGSGFTLAAQGINGVDQYGYFNGIQFVQTPEPGSIGMFALGFVALLRFGRRSK